MFWPCWASYRDDELMSAAARRHSLAERDVEIPPNVVARAADDHVLIVRTLDLIRLKQLALRGERRADELVDAVRSGGGWFEIDASLVPHLHRQ